MDIKTTDGKAVCKINKTEAKAFDTVIGILDTLHRLGRPDVGATSAALANLKGKLLAGSPAIPSEPPPAPLPSSQAATPDQPSQSDTDPA